MSAIIEIKNLNYVYSRKTPYEKWALKNINLSINEGEFFGIIGHTGCGKSTLIAHLNALNAVQSGEIIINGQLLTEENGVSNPMDDASSVGAHVPIRPHNTFVLTSKKLKRKVAKELRNVVGMVFQYPEHQLFADSVLADVSFGPKNMRLTKDEIFTRAKEAIEWVGLDFEKIKDRSVFELSGGQKRRVAIAGVLAMRPQILILDEPTSGLDPRGKKEILDLILKIKKDICKTVVMISHNMDEVSKIADRIAVMANGEIVCVKTPKELFSEKETLQKLDIAMPNATDFALQLKEQGYDIDTSVVTIDELASEIVRVLQ